MEKRFWEDEPFRIKGGRSLNGLLARATYYPNDHNPREPIPEREEVQATYDMYTQPMGTLSPEEETALAATQSRPGPWLMLSSYTFGEHAEEMGKPGREPEDTVPDVERVFGKFEFHKEDSEIWYWNDPHLARWAKGPFALPAPGVISRFYHDALRPEGRVFFAGDHVSFAPGWIQGSLFSSLWNLQLQLQSAAGEDVEGAMP